VPALHCHRHRLTCTVHAFGGQRAVSQPNSTRRQSFEKLHPQPWRDEAALDNAQLNLGWTSVTSPIAGIAGVSKVGIGDLIIPTAVMTTVSSVNPIYVDVNIAEQDYLRSVAKKRTGMDVQIWS